MKHKRTKNIEITTAEVRRIKFKKLTKGAAALSKAEAAIYEKYDFDGKKAFRRTFRYVARPIEKIRADIAKGKAPRVLAKVPIK